MSQYKHYNLITEAHHGNKLYLGDFNSAEDQDNLILLNVRTVITAAEGYFLNYDSAIKHYKYALKDIKSQNIGRYFDEVIDKIKHGLDVGSVLVHCAAGVSRSATLVIAYLMKTNKMTFHEALAYCKTRRPQVCPNIGFERQLKLYQQSLRNQWRRVKQLPESSNSTTLPEIIVMKTSSFPERKKARTPNKTYYIERKQNEKNASQEKIRKNLFSQSQEQYLKKIAEFRFGITNFDKWRS